MKLPKILLLCVVLGFMGACATQKVESINPILELPKDLPKEYQEKFKLEEPVPMASPTPTPTPEALLKKKKKKKSTGSAGAFIYPNKRPIKDPIWLNEKLVYELTYFGVAAGTFTMTVQPFMTINHRQVYHLRGHARTSKFFEVFYRVDDTVESFLDYEGIFSHRFHLILNETKQTRDALELYDSEKAQAFYWNNWNHYQKGHIETKEFFPMDRFPQDSISAIYYIRSLPLSVGGKYRFPVVSEGKTWEAEIEVKGTEMMDTPMGRVRCLILRPETRFQGVLKKTGESLFWVTDDDRRILIRIEAKVKIGAVVAQLKEADLGTPP